MHTIVVFFGEERIMSAWRKSTRSAGEMACVELRSSEEGFQVRDSKLGERSPALDMTSADLTGLLRAAKD